MKLEEVMSVGATSQNEEHQLKHRAEGRETGRQERGERGERGRKRRGR